MLIIMLNAFSEGWVKAGRQAIMTSEYDRRPRRSGVVLVLIGRDMSAWICAGDATSMQAEPQDDRLMTLQEARKETLPKFLLRLLSFLQAKHSARQFRAVQERDDKAPIGLGDPAETGIGLKRSRQPRSVIIFPHSSSVPLCSSSSRLFVGPVTMRLDG